MRNFRTFLVMLLCVLIPLQGYAYSALPMLYCPMNNAMDEQAIGQSANHPCCNDKATTEKTGKVCKVELQCQTSGHFSFYSATSTQMPVLVQSEYISFDAVSSRSFDLSAVWRPPTFF